MAKIIGLKSLQQALRQELAKKVDFGGPVGSVVVGYTANYALYVHENLEAKHGAAYNAAHGGEKPRGPNQQAKYLEKPARELNNSGELSRIVTAAMKRRVKLQQALFLAGLRIQRESQEIVPVDTGNLKGSVFTRKE